jgi:hypothetical protein
MVSVARGGPSAQFPDDVQSDRGRHLPSSRAASGGSSGAQGGQGGVAAGVRLDHETKLPAQIAQRFPGCRLSSAIRMLRPA